MSYLIDYKGCKTVVRDVQSHQVIADTTILEYDKKTAVATLDSSDFNTLDCTRITMLVLYEGVLYEFHGNIRRPAPPGRVVIAMFKGRVKEDRTARRYAVNAPAMIESLIINGRQEPLPYPEPATIINISTGGMLLRVESMKIGAAASFRVRLMIDGTPTYLNNCAVRTHKKGPGYIEYGCAFLPD